jgi:hypothetical protein
MCLIKSPGDLNVGCETDEGKGIVYDFTFAGHKVFRKEN